MDKFIYLFCYEMAGLFKYLFHNAIQELVAKEENF